MTHGIRLIGLALAVAAGLALLSNLASGVSDAPKTDGRPAVTGAVALAPETADHGSAGGPAAEHPIPDPEPFAEARGDESEPGDFGRLADGILNDRATRFRVLDVLASGAVPPGEKRSRLLEWLRASGDAEAIARLDAVLRDLEARRYDAATADESRLLHQILEGDAAARREALETIRPELLASATVRSTLREIVLGPNADLARAGMLALSRADDADTAAFLESVLGAVNLDPGVRVAAASALSSRRGESVSRALASRLADSGECVEVKRFAANGLSGQETTPALVAALIGSYRNELDFSVRVNAVVALQAHASSPEVRAELSSILENDPSDDIRALAMATLAMAGIDVERVLATGRKDVSPKVREMARSFSMQSP